MSVEEKINLLREFMNDGMITNEQAAEILQGESEKMAAPVQTVEVPEDEQHLYRIKVAMVDAFREATKDRKLMPQEALLLGGEMMQFFGITDPVGIRILGFSDLCFCEGKEQFTVIPYDVWQEVKTFAEAQLEQFGDTMLASHRSHMIDVRDGKVPFGLSVAEKPVKLEGAANGNESTVD